MFQINNRLFALAAISLATAAGTASADTINSYNIVASSISGVTITPALQSPNLSFTVTLAAGATFTYNSVVYHIQDIIGFDMLGFGFNDLNQSALPTIGGFQDDSDHRAAGSLYGWRSNPNQGITAGNSETFTYPSLSAAQYAGYSTFGLHVRLVSPELFPGTTGNTGNLVVPTPGAAALLGLGGLALSRRRRA